MQLLEVFSNLLILLSGIFCAVYIIRKWSCFDLWVSIPVCGAWIVKGIRCLYYDWAITAINNLEAAQIFGFMVKTHRVLGGLDVLAMILLCAVLLRLVNQGFYLRRYNKEIKSFHK